MDQQSEATGGPTSGRPRMPSGYGIEKTNEGQLPWSWAEERLISARNYWICTTRPDGRPHAMPVWGLWLNGALFFSTDPESQKGRNLARNPAIVVHLESGDDTVILEGAAERLAVAALPGSFADRYEAKYNFRPGLGENEGYYTLRPSIAHAWREQDFPTSATRWRFPE